MNVTQFRWTDVGLSDAPWNVGGWYMNLSFTELGRAADGNTNASVMLEMRCETLNHSSEHLQSYVCNGHWAVICPETCGCDILTGASKSCATQCRSKASSERSFLLGDASNRAFGF